MTEKKVWRKKGGMRQSGGARPGSRPAWSGKPRSDAPQREGKPAYAGKPAWSGKPRSDAPQREDKPASAGKPAWSSKPRSDAPRREGKPASAGKPAWSGKPRSDAPRREGKPAYAGKPAWSGKPRSDAPRREGKPASAGKQPFTGERKRGAAPGKGAPAFRVKPMKKPLEILAPGGSLEAIAVAVAHGANAVYAGVGTLNARATAQNLALEQLPALAEWLHSRAVKFYVALNVPVTASKRAEAVRVLVACHLAGVDAVILRDEMLMRLAHEHCPGLAVHASTQCAALTVEAARRLQQLGCTRVVVPRELSRRDIAALHRACPGLELETFVFGAMCFAVSGLCLLGEAVAGRSGNYGTCAQACRLPYFSPDGTPRGHLFSMKDLDLTGHLNDLAESGVTAVKIEGRLKPAAYVGCVTRALSNAMQRGGTLAKPQLEEFRRDIAVIWSRARGEGFFTGKTTAAELTDPTASGHRGLAVSSFTSGLRNNEQMLVFTAPVPLAVHDGLLLGVRDSANTLSERPFVLKRLYDARNRPVKIVKAEQVLQTPVPRGWRVVSVAVHSAHLVSNKYTGVAGPDPAKLTTLPLQYEAVALADGSLQLTGVCGRFRHEARFELPTEPSRGESCSPEHLRPLFGAARYRIQPGLYANPKYLRECRREFVAQFSTAYAAAFDEQAVAVLRAGLQQDWPEPPAESELLAQQAAVSWVTGLPAGEVRTSAGDTFALEEHHGRTRVAWRGRQRSDAAGQ